MSFYDLINGADRLDASFYGLNALAAIVYYRCRSGKVPETPLLSVSPRRRRVHRQAWCDRSGTHAGRSAGR
jgi:hypothetical protein